MCKDMRLNKILCIDAQRDTARQNHLSAPFARRIKDTPY